MKKIIFGTIFTVFALALVVVSAFAAQPTDKGFDSAGYNDTARIFNGTGWSWCMDKVGDATWCTNYLGTSANDKIVMKWNAAWDACNTYNTPLACAGAWTSNEWNGMKDGSDSVWHYKIVYVGPCTDGQVVDGGGYCIWGQYSVLMDQGVYKDDGHVWSAPHGIPNGYGAYK